MGDSQMQEHESDWIRQPVRDGIVDGHCGICGSACAVRIHLEDGKIQRLPPRPNHPHGITCRRITRVHDIVYSPQRLLYPQRGTGPRGTRQLSRISWDEALDHTADVLRDIAIALANKLGYGHLYPRNVDEMVEWAFEGTGLGLEELRRHPEGIELPHAPMQYRKWEKGLLRPNGKPGFDTPSSKYEIASTILQRYGYASLPVFSPPAEGPLGSPKLTQRYPLVFNSGSRNKVFFNSQHHHVPSLVKRYPQPVVRIHPGDAEPRSIVEGDKVVVATPRGRVTYTAHVTENILPGVVEADAHGGGYLAAPAWKQCNANELTDHDNRDPLSGFPVYKALLCQVSKAEQGESGGAADAGRPETRETP